MPEGFHFLRPWWLLAIVPLVALGACIWRGQATANLWRGVIAPHLLEFLRVGRESRRRVRPVVLLVAAWVVGCLALAGPSWQREPAPFADDTAALAIAVEVTPSMMARDVEPTRLDRAVHKIEDLLALRAGAKTALIAYSGSAHRVMPLTRDARVIETFAAELAPEILPIEGDATRQALELSDRQLAEAGVSGSILLITDGIPAAELEGFSTRAPVHVLAVGTDGSVTPPGPPAPALNVDALEAASSTLGGSLTIVTPDDRDVRRVAGQVETVLAAAEAPDGGERWRDAGYWLVPVIVLLCLVWFRPGWTVVYS